MRKGYLIVLFAILFSLDMARCQTKDYKEKLESMYNYTVPMIYSSELAKQLNAEQSTVILDIRSNEEYHVSHLKGAIEIDYDNFEEKDVANIPLDSEIIVYCSVGYRSEKIGEDLLEMGFTNVKNLYGGIFQWKNDGFEVVNKYSAPTDSVHTYNKSWSQWLLNGVRVF